MKQRDASNDRDNANDRDRASRHLFNKIYLVLLRCF
jgi:hypothetical protein